MLRSILRAWRRAPVSHVVGWICLVLFVLTQPGTWPGDDLSQQQLLDDLGASTAKQFVEAPRTGVEAPGDQLNGPFDVWDGQWWRVFVNAFHHANLLHLGMNLLSLASLGPLLERRWGSLTYLLLTVVSAGLTVATEMLLGHVAIGISGSICAMFGAILVLREDDEELAKLLSEQGIRLTLGFLYLMLLLTWMDVVPVANLAHFTGLLYGYLFAACLHRRWPARVWRWAGFLLLQLLVIPALIFVVNPVWNGVWCWYKAAESENPDVQLAWLEAAAARSPDLPGVWQSLAQVHNREGDLIRGWESLLMGLRANPNDEPTLRMARRFWRSLVSGGMRKQAEERLVTVFGASAPAWEEQIRQTWLLDRGSLNEAMPLFWDLDEAEVLQLRDPELHHPKRDDSPLAPPDPDAPDSALEGLPG